MTAIADDLELSLRRHSADTYTADVQFRPGDSMAESFLAVDVPIQFDLEQLRAAELDPRAYGRSLTGMLFANPLLVDAFRVARAHAQGAGIQLRVRLRLGQRDSVLHTIRWETLQDPTATEDYFLAPNSQILLSRYLDVRDIHAINTRPREELHALIVVANPTDLEDYDLPLIDVPGEVERARLSLGSIASTVLASADDDVRPTWANVMAALHREVDILYLVCHGTKHDGMNYLWLERDDGCVDRIATTTITERIHELSHRPLLVVLAACQTAEPSHTGTDTLMALGPELVHAGIGAVVAMHDRIAQATITQGMPLFFSHLRESGIVDQALAAARSVLIDQDADWWRLVLFLRLRDGRLWSAVRRDQVFQAPSLPMHFVPRPEITRLIKERLLSNTDVRPGVLARSAIQGGAGVGKSTLAAALAHDPDIQTHFGDGMLWAESGQDPDVAAMLRDWLDALGDPVDHSLSIAALAGRLRGQLRDKKMLLVIDNVWYTQSIEPLLGGGQWCHVLLTTRQIDIVAQAGAHHYELGVLTPEQALALLALRLERELVETERAEAAQLAETVEYLPLALELAAARIHHAAGMTWGKLRDALTQEVARLEALDGPRRVRNETRGIEASFNLSLEALRVDDHVAWQCFVWLGVLPEGTPITAPMLMALWDVDLNEAERMLELLWMEALLLARDYCTIRGTDWQAYRIHTLLHTFARQILITAPPYGLGLALPDAHAALLERYRAYTEQHLWHTLPDDGYIHAHLRWHMEQAEWHHEIHTLLRETTPTGHHGWFVARERLGQVAGYMTDLQRAWEIADRKLATESAPEMLRLQYRYLLLTASLNSMAGNILPPLLAELVAQDVWTPVQALAYARRVPDASQRVSMLVALAGRADQSTSHEALYEALVAARTLDDGAVLEQALAVLVPHLPPPLIPDAQELLTFSYPELQVIVLTALLPRIAQYGDPSAAFVTAQTMADEQIRAATLVAMMPHLPEPLREEVRQSAQTIRSRRLRASTLAQLDRYTTEQYLPQVLKLVDEIEDGWERAHALAEIAPALPLPLLHIALNEVPELRRAEQRHVAYAALLPRLAALGFPQKALNRTRAIEDEWMRATAVVRMAAYLPDSLLVRVLSLSREFARRDAQVHVLVGIAAYLPESVLRQALQMAETLPTNEDRKRVLVELIPRVAQIGDPQVALQRALALRDLRARAEALIRVAPHLDEPDIARVLAEVQRVGYGAARAEAVAQLAPYLPASLLLSALQAVRPIGDIWARVEIQARLVERLTQPAQERVFQTMLELPQSAARMRGLALTAPHVPESLLSSALAVPLPEHEWRWVEDITALGPHLSPAGCEHALTTTRQLTDPHVQVGAFAQLAHCLPDVIPEALRIARALDTGRARAFVRLAPALSEPELREALVAVRLLGNVRARAEVLGQLAPYLPEPLLRQAFAIVQSFGDTQARIEAFGQLAPYLSETLVREAVRFVRSVHQIEGRTQALARLVPRLVALGHPQEALRIAWSVQQPEHQATILAALIPQLALSGFVQEAYETAQSIRSPQLRAVMVAQLAPHLPTSFVRRGLATLSLDEAEERQVMISLLVRLATLGFVGDALELAWSIEDVETQIKALMELLPHVPAQVLLAVYQRVQTYQHSDTRTALCVLLLVYLVEKQCPPAVVAALWSETLHALATQDRRVVLAQIQTLIPVFIALGGVADELLETIEEIGRVFA